MPIHLKVMLGGESSPEEMRGRHCWVGEIESLQCSQGGCYAEASSVASIPEPGVCNKMGHLMGMVEELHHLRADRVVGRVEGVTPRLVQQQKGTDYTGRSKSDHRASIGYPVDARDLNL